MATMITDDWEGVRANNRVTDDVGWADVEAAIRQLDGRRHTQVVLQLPDHSDIVIGGGSGRYNVCIGTPDDRFFVLRDPRNPEGTEELIAGGQLGRYRAEVVVGVEQALRAAQVFFELGLADDTLDWIEE